MHDRDEGIDDNSNSATGCHQLCLLVWLEAQRSSKGSLKHGRSVVKHSMMQRQQR